MIQSNKSNLSNWLNIYIQNEYKPAEEFEWTVHSLRKRKYLKRDATWYIKWFEEYSDQRLERSVMWQIQMEVDYCENELSRRFFAADGNDSTNVNHLMWCIDDVIVFYQYIMVFFIITSKNIPKTSSTLYSKLLTQL